VQVYSRPTILPKKFSKPVSTGLTPKHLNLGHLCVIIFTYHLRAPKCKKSVGRRGSTLDPAGGAYDAPPDALVGYGGGNPLDACGVPILGAAPQSRPPDLQERPAVADKPARRLRKVCMVYIRVVGL